MTLVFGLIWQTVLLILETLLGRAWDAAQPTHTPHVSHASHDRRCAAHDRSRVIFCTKVAILGLKIICRNHGSSIARRGPVSRHTATILSSAVEIINPQLGTIIVVLNEVRSLLEIELSLLLYDLRLMISTSTFAFRLEIVLLFSRAFFDVDFSRAPAYAFVVVGSCVFEELVGFALLEGGSIRVLSVGLGGSGRCWLDAGRVGGDAVGAHHAFVAFGSVGGDYQLQFLELERRERRVKS
jgi:hypothetical protein